MSELAVPEADSANKIRDRSPHPYTNLHYADSVGDVSQVNKGKDSVPSTSSSSPQAETYRDAERRHAHSLTGTGSESGTEADDEKPHLLKALPPPAFRPRKGLKTNDGGASPLLTPSQLDQQGRRFSKDEYFQPKREDDSTGVAKEDQLEQERRKFAAQRRAERVRRICEGALIGAIGLTVAYGSRLWTFNWPWYLAEILSQVLAIAGLVLFYPIRLVSIEHQKGHLHIWSRFYIPPSFDPATVLYPTFLPALVSLSLIQRTPGLIVPNLILGLSSLPARLFPAWSWRLDINALHWAISLVPLLTCSILDTLARRFPLLRTFAAPPDCMGLPSEVTVLLYPLHHSVLPIIDYLTATSLLPSEKHLLSTACINVLLFAQSSQIIFLRSILWIGGLGILILLRPVLHWSVLLARIPTWRLRRITRSNPRPKLTDELMDEFRSALGRIFGKPAIELSEDSSEDDEPVRRHLARAPSLSIRTSSRTFDDSPQSAVEKPANGFTNGAMSGRRDSKDLLFRRRNTIAAVDAHPPISSFTFPAANMRQRKSKPGDWVLDLSPEKVRIRKVVYATFFYLTVLFLGLVPMRIDVSRHALHNAEPIFWAIDYLLSDLPSPSTIISTIRSPPPLSSILAKIPATSSIPSFRSSIREANTRLLVLAYWLLPLTMGLTLVTLLSSHIEVDTRRKIFHGIMVSMLLPTIFIDPLFCALALILVLAIFLLLEVVRAGQVPPLGPAIGRFVAPYVDGRDLRGPMVVSHVFLLVGCAIPLWLALAGMGREEDSQKTRWRGWDLDGEKRQIAMVSGVVCVGMGDAAASLIGRRYGRRKWPWIGGKSLEGSAAFAIAVLLGLGAAKVWLVVGGWEDVNPIEGFGRTDLTAWTMFGAKALAAGCGASFMEAVLTGANDNVVVPIALWLLTRGLRL